MKLIKLPYEHYVIVDRFFSANIGDWCLEFDLSWKPLITFIYNGKVPGECLWGKITHSNFPIEGTVPLYTFQIGDLIREWELRTAFEFGKSLKSYDCFEEMLLHLNNTKEWEVEFNDSGKLKIIEP